VDLGPTHLILLQQQGLIKLRDGVGISAGPSGPILPPF
jgi:hypothetical protein